MMDDDVDGADDDAVWLGADWWDDDDDDIAPDDSDDDDVVGFDCDPDDLLLASKSISSPWTLK